MPYDFFFSLLVLSWLLIMQMNGMGHLYHGVMAGSGVVMEDLPYKHV